jgi:AmpE protein
MTFIVVLFSLLIERFFDWSHLRQWGWYSTCERLVIQKMPKASPETVLVASILPLMAFLFLLKILMVNILYGVPLLFLQLFVLLYCYGPHNLWVDTFASITALTKDSKEAAAQKLQSAFNVASVNNAEPLHHQLLSQIFISSNQRVFAVIFWFMILGLPGALLYRLINVSTQAAAGPAISGSSVVIKGYLDWIPARILTFIFALGGNFTKVLNIWRQRAKVGPEGNDVLLTECGMAAINDNNEKLPEDGSLERSAVTLLDRVFIIALVGVLFVVVIF